MRSVPYSASGVVGRGAAFLLLVVAAAGVALACRACRLCCEAFLCGAVLDVAQSASVERRGTISPLTRSSAMSCFMEG